MSGGVNLGLFGTVNGDTVTYDGTTYNLNSSEEKSAYQARAEANASAKGAEWGEKLGEKLHGPLGVWCCGSCASISSISGIALLIFGILGAAAVLPMGTGVSVTMIVFGSIFLAMGACGGCCAACCRSAREDDA